MVHVGGEISTSAPSKRAAQVLAQSKRLSGTVCNMSEASLAHLACDLEGRWWKRGCDDRECRPCRKQCSQREKMCLKLPTGIHIDEHRKECESMPLDIPFAGVREVHVGWPSPRLTSSWTPFTATGMNLTMLDDPHEL